MSEALPQQRYKRVLYGGGVEEHDRFGIRDLIRSGEVAAGTELAVTGTDDWRAADSYPELARYFSLVTARPQASPGPLVAPSKPRVVQPMKQRVIEGMLYPLAGGEVLMLIGLAVLSMLPILSRIAALASTLIMVGIIRASADGKTKMPLVDTSNLWDLVRTSLRVLFISIVALLPAVGIGIVVGSALVAKAITVQIAVAGMVLALAVSAAYYPACLATVAVWDDILSSLNPVYVAKVIRTMGSDYFIAIAVFFVATLGVSLLQLPFVPRIPIAGPLLQSVASYWALFYASHILGYAVYRHAPALGWE